MAYSDNTSILAWLTLQKGIVSFHGPMIDRRFSRGAEGYDRDTFARVVCEARPAGEIVHPAVEVLKPGEAAGMLIGGTLTQLVGSLGTPFAFDPPPGHVLFIDEVAERPYRVDRMFTQLRQSGRLARAAALVFGELPRCDEPGGDPAIRAVVADLIADFPGPVLFGLPSGHTTGPDADPALRRPRPGRRGAAPSGAGDRRSGGLVMKMRARSASEPRERSGARGPRERPPSRGALRRGLAAASAEAEACQGVRGTKSPGEK